MADQGDDPRSEFQSRLNEYAVGLEAMVEQEEAEATDLALKLQVKKDNIRRIREAIGKLRGQDATTTKKVQHVNRMRHSTREAIVGAIRRAGEEGVTLGSLVEETGLGEETIRRGLRILRDENLVRRAGINEARENLFKAMPEMALNGS